MIIILFTSILGIGAILLLVSFQGSLDIRSNASYRYPWEDPRASNAPPIPSYSPRPRSPRPSITPTPPPGSGVVIPAPSSLPPRNSSPPPDFRLPVRPSSTPPPGTPPPGQSW